MSESDSNRVPHPVAGDAPGDALPRLERELAFLVRWLEAVQRRRDYAMERAHYLMLLLLMEDGPQSVSRIAERLRLDASTVTRQVAVMVRRGLVHKERNPEDRRGGTVCATALGRTEARQMRDQRTARIEALFAAWPEDKRQLMGELLGDLNESLGHVLDRDEDAPA